MALLGSMILDPAVIGDVIQIVKTPEDFYRAAHGAIFQALVDLYDQHNAGDIAMLHQLLVDRGVTEEVGGVDYLVRLAEQVPAAINAVHYANIVAEKAVLRRLIAAAGEILHTAYTTPENAREVLDAAERVIFEIAQHAERRDAESLEALLHQTLELIESHHGRVITGLETGFREFDEMTSGLQAGDMIILAARPSMGKTAFALNLAENVALMGNPVGVFSLEMSKQQLAQRLLCSYAEVDSHKLRRNLLGHEELKRLVFKVGELSEAPIFIDDTPGLSVLELRAKARRMVAKHGVKLILIDYLQLMSCPGRENRQQEVSEMSRGVKALARELNVPVICLSQLNRAAENREDHRPRMSDLRESGSIEQDADMVLMLHREDYYEQHKEDYVPTNIAELIIAKQRNGPTGTARMTWVGSSTKFKNYSPAMAPPDYRSAPSGPMMPDDIPI
jgi:replicative DNA helicase